MFCKNCGKNLGEVQNDLCAECEATLNTSPIIDENVDVIKEIGKEKEEKENIGKDSTNNENDNKKAKSKVTAGLFGIFLGYLGVHNFYLGYTGKAVAQLLLTILSCGSLSFVSGIWGFVEGILILTGEISTDADGVKLVD